MQSKGRAGGFTLSELIVVVGIIAVLTAIIFPVFANAREAARVATCANNLYQIGVAAQLYHQDHHGPPMSRLPVSLGSYITAPSVFVCPNDRSHTDSYSAFFLGRYHSAKAGEFLVGCPRHQRGDKTAILCGKGNGDVGSSGIVLHNGVEVHAGDEVIGGVLTFADGSRVDISEGLGVVVITSASTDEGLHSVIYVPAEQPGWLNVNVVPGNKFEVATPASVAAVRGTQFTVSVDYENGCLTTWVSVYRGEVVVESRLTQKKTILRRYDYIRMPSDLTPGRTNTWDSGPGPWRNLDDGIADPYW